MVEEVRKIREAVARREAENPEKFHRDAMKKAARYGIKKSNLKPIKIDFSRLSKKTNEEDAA